MKLLERLFAGMRRLPPDDVLQTRLLEVARAMALSLAYENRSEGLFVWRFQLVVPTASHPFSGCISWYMKRVRNEIYLDDPCLFENVAGMSLEEMEQRAVAVQQLQEDFKQRWLALVGPVALRGPSPRTHRSEFQLSVMKDIVEKLSPEALAQLQLDLLKAQALEELRLQD